jgi:hypothetical protein
MISFLPPPPTTPTLAVNGLLDLKILGANYLNGGAGADQFWLVSGAKNLPAAKQFVKDYTPVDKVGLRGYAFADLSFTQAGSDTLLTIGTTAALITQLTPHRAGWAYRVVRKYQSGHGSRCRPVPERSLPA